MNRTLLSCLALLLPAAALAQFPYDLTVLDQPYTPLEEATALPAAAYDDELGWDDPDFSLPSALTFLFWICRDAMDQIGLGSLMMGTTIDGAILLHGVMPTNYDLADRAINREGPLHHPLETTGCPGAGLYHRVGQCRDV